MAHISTEEVREIRKALKENFPKVKFSVTKRAHGLCVGVAIMKSEYDFSEIIGDRGHASINPCWPEKYGVHAELFKKIVKIIKTAPAKAEGGEEWYDNSDIMTDYFDTAFYLMVEVGKWDKPYEMV